MLIPHFVVAMVSVGMVVLNAGKVSSQDYPNKPIRIITGGAGGGNDFVSRLIAPMLTGNLGQPVVVENRGGVISGEIVSKAQPDGYTLLVHGSTFWNAPLLQNAPFDPIRDFSPITLAFRSPNVLVVHPSLPVKSVKELIALAKARPGELNISSGSIGGGGHIAAELFKAMADVHIVNIPYRTPSQEASDLIGGQVQLTFQDGSFVEPHLKSGRLRALAVGSVEPSALFPGLPTVGATLPGFESTSKSATFAPAKTPRTIINRLNQEIVRVLSQADVRQRLLDSGAEAATSSPDELAAIIKAEITRVSNVVKNAGIKAN